LQDPGDRSFRLLVDSITDHGIVMLTPAGQIASWNLGAQEIHGYPAAEILGRHFSLFHTDEAIARGWPQHQLQQAAEVGRFEDDGWRVRKGGDWFWANVVTSAMRDERGMLTGYSQVTRDFSERKLREEQVAQSELRFRSLVDGVTDYAIFMLDRNGLIASWNRGAQVIKGYTAEEVLGTHFSRFYPSEALTRNWPEHELHAAREHGRFEDIGWRVRRDGTRFWANVVITAIRAADGSVRGYSKITRDLTERLENEERLKRSEERFRLLVEGVKDYAIFMLDPGGTVVSWNVGAERIKGYSANEIIGQPFTRFYPQEDVQAGKPWQKLEAARRRGSARDEGWRVRKDGTRFLADVVITALYDQAGTLHGYAKVTRDLTQAKRIEILETEGQRINEFLAMLAHELRNPLAPIRNAVSLMEAGAMNGERLEWCRNVIGRQTSHLTRLVDDLLDISRITSGKIKLYMEELELATLITRGVEASLPLIKSREHSLTMTMPEQPVRLEGDPTRLVQVISNLLNNAAKYTPSRGTIDITMVVDGDRAAIRVSDNGIGMPADLIDMVFDLFQQGNRELDRTEGGLGIGLTLVDRIVALHGGSVEARSQGIGRGSEFVVWLPILLEKDEQAPVAEVRDTSESNTSQRLRVLIVDDNHDAAETMAMLIDITGNEAQTLHEGSSAAAAVRNYKPHLVLLDIGLPGMNGYEVARQIKSCEDLRHITLVAVTGYGHEQDRKRAAEAGFDEFVVKPISFERLSELMAKLVEATERRQ
jgi:PAS domain S-box-containing protein